MLHRADEMLVEQLKARIERASRDAWMYESVPKARAARIWKNVWGS